MEEKITDSTAVYFLKRMINRFNDDNVTALAAESTYYFILGLIPFMIFFVNAMLFFAAPQVDLITKAVHYLPQQVAVTLQANINRILQARSSIWLVVGLATALWTASQGVTTLIHGLRLLWRQGQAVLYQSQNQVTHLHDAHLICDDPFPWSYRFRKRSRLCDCLLLQCGGCIS